MPAFAGAVREAVTADVPAIAAVAAAAWRDTYAGLLAPATIEWFLATAYSAEVLARRIERSAFLVAVADGSVVAFANAAARADHVVLAAIYADPARRGGGAGSALLVALRERWPGLPIGADVLVGNRLGEAWYAARGFVPGEAVDEVLGEERVVERRWWLGRGP